MTVLDFPTPTHVGHIHEHGGASWMWDGVAWMQYVPDEPSVIVSDDAPTDVPEGTVWFDSLTAQTLVLYGTAWVEIGATGVTSSSSGGGGGGGTGQVIIDSDDILVEEDGQLMLVHSTTTINGISFALGGGGTLDTDDISEGATNQYFTDERALSAVGQAIVDGDQQGITVTYDEVSHSIDFAVAPGGIADSSITSVKLNLSYADQTSFPAATLGKVAYSLADSALYFADGGVWVRLAEQTETSLAIATAESNSVSYTNTSVSTATTAIQSYANAAVLVETNARIAADIYAIDSDQTIIASAMFG